MKEVDWLQRCVIFLTGVFLFSFLTWLSAYLLPETIQLITWVLVITCTVEMFFPFKKWGRWIIELLACFILILFILKWKIVFPHENTWAHLIEFLIQNIIRLDVLFPYLSFGLGSWLVYLIMVRWFESKWRALATILICAITLTIIDTFTFHNLWGDITLMISAVLLLLIVDHFKVLRKKSPEGWNHLKDYPATVVVPIIIFFTVVVISTIFVPENVRPLLTDPYTAWKKYLGEEPEISRYTERVDNGHIDKKERLSGYSRDDSQLGGGFEFDYSQIMSVETSYPTYFRGETRYFYNGTGWEEQDLSYHLENHELLLDQKSEALTGLEHSKINRSLLQTREIVQTISIYPNSVYSGSVLLGSYRMDSIEIIDQTERDDEILIDSIVDNSQIEINTSTPLLWLPNVGELHYIDDSGMFPQKYQVTSKVPLIDKTGLRNAPLIDREDAFWERYLQLPSNLPTRVSELAKEVVANQTNPYDQVKAIEFYLKDTFPYTNEPDESLGKSDDFVDRFLFEIQEGYCDYYSTAMVVLTRTLGIPARWVKGYTQGNRNDDLDPHYLVDRNQLGPGVYIVQNANAHSWVEIYFHGYGWIPFEPTASFSAPTLEVQEVTVTPETDENELVEVEKSLSLATIVQNLLIVLGIVVIFSVSLILLLKRRKWLYWHILKRHRVKSVNQKIIIEIERLLNYGHRRSYQNFKNQTLKETFKRWIHQNKLLEMDLQELEILFEQAKYGVRDMSDKELLLAQEKIRSIKRIMRIRI
ncbi:hypothetical protein GH741_12160 [Aquibacillus halophilus]|uniref:Transglutaminase-like domain-containing protein n=1 Tax=Aquibacillus halophilus TaxID=930132 RepID=A0A6A8DQC4_9BACI|nr:transglutaminase domain-containing protein [Aquibacillus halophilus]MRH43432.1 hypothetical protein [Aquibacillus halophilus]